MSLSAELERAFEYLSRLGFRECEKSLVVKDVLALKSSLRFFRSSEISFLIVIAVHKNKYRNQIMKIRCRGGTPIGGYQHDNVNDCYEVSCVHYLSLGYIPISFQLTNDDCPHWATYVPLPESVIIRYLNDIQKMNLDKFKTQFDDNFSFEYLQMVN